MDGICILETGAASASASVLSDTQNLRKDLGCLPVCPPFFPKMLARYLRRFVLGPLVVRLKTEFLVFNSACFLLVDRAHFNAFISSPDHPPKPPQIYYKSVVTAQACQDQD